MNRRDFLKVAVAVPVVASLPATAEARPFLDVAKIKAVIQAYPVDGGPWYAILHPRQERDLRDIAARERWAGAYVAWRKEGKPELSCRQILDKYTPIRAWDFDCSEVGSYEGIRFIESGSL